MAHIAKRTKEMRGKIDPTKNYPLADAIKMVKEGATAKFNESIDVAINLGVDAKKSDQLVRGSIVLPQGTVRRCASRCSLRARRQRLRRLRAPHRRPG
jgi:large subunit ribosomal protein L1